MSYFGLAQGTSISTLFGSLSNTQSSQKNTGSSLTFLSDYASIRNGSYRKLLNAYYKTGSKNFLKEETISTSKVSAEKLTDLQKEADSLKDSAKELYSSGSQSVFRKMEVKQEDGTTKKDYNKDAIYKKVTEFVEDYNDLLDASKDISSANVERSISNLKTSTEFQKKFLAEIGIEVKSDGSLSVDEKKLKASDMGKVENLFKGTGSYGYQVGVRASMVENTVQREASKANTYTQFGNYSKNYNYSYQYYI